MLSAMNLAIFSVLAFVTALFPSLTYAPDTKEALGATASTSNVTIIFAGDVMFDRTIRTAIDQKGGDFIFSCIDSTLANSDFAVVNLEGPITENASVSETSSPEGESNYTFTFSTSTAELLLAHKIAVVNLGNNHIQNFGREGVLSTVSALKGAGVGYFGDPINFRAAEGKVYGVPFAFVSYNEFSAGNAASTTISQITRERAEGFLPIVYAHWGVEYATTSPERIKALARQFVDAGAEIIVGSHPHVVEDREVYGGKYIYYSLGNFIFDQYWNDDVKQGLLLQVVFAPDGVLSVKEIPIELGLDRRTCVSINT